MNTFYIKSVFEILKSFKNFFDIIQHEFNRCIRIRIDNDFEFMNNVFVIFIRNRMVERLIEYLAIERRTEYIQYEGSSKSNNARDYTNYSTLKAISVKISTLSFVFMSQQRYSTIFKFIIIISDIQAFNYIQAIDHAQRYSSSQLCSARLKQYIQLNS